MDAAVQGWEAAMGLPKMQFARAGDVNVAYQVVGDGPVDLVWAWGMASSIETAWEEPSYAAFLRRLSEFCRLILFDRRGCGASDREGTTSTPTLEERMEDIIAVLDAVGSERASLFGISEGGNLAAVFAATHPDRTRSIIVYGTVARIIRDAEHPWGLLDDDERTAFYDMVSQGWGTTEGAVSRVAVWAASMTGDERFIEWQAKHARQSVSRSAILPLMKSLEAYDLVDVFPAVHVPSLVLHRRDDPLVPISQGRYIAAHIPDARFVELAGVDHYPFVGDAEEILAEVEDFLVGSRGQTPFRRRLLTIVFTDIADSTRRVTGLGDDAWRELLAAHDEMVRAHLTRFNGVEVKHLGDGFLAAFDGPARAIRCAIGVMDGAARIGLSAKIGVHTGECEVIDDDIRGIAVHVCARLVQLAHRGEILVSGTVRDLVAGSGIRFGEEREVELEGIAGPRTVLPVLTHGASPETVRRLAIEQANVLRRDGEYWTAAFDGLVATLRDSKGIRDLARLLALPHQELHVTDLGAEGDPGALTMRRANSFEPVIDETARANYRSRLTELDEQIEECDARGDDAGSARGRAERDALVDELTRAYGLGGQVRRSPDHIERARKAVTRRIRDAMSRIDRVHPALGRHLDASIRTGVFCSYQPERDVAWTIEVT